MGNNKTIDDYEIDPGQLKLGVEIGKGAFGRVHLATVENLPGQPGPTLAAVKQMKSNSYISMSSKSYSVIVCFFFRKSWSKRKRRFPG